MRVLAFCDYFSADSSGGSERAAWEIYRRLAARGIAIRVITALPAEYRPFPSVPGMEVRSVPVIELQRALHLQASLSPALFIKRHQLAAGFQPDVLHANTLFFQTSVAAALTQVASRLPLVTTVQIAGLDFLRGPGRIAASAYERTIGRWILARSRRVVAVSESVRQHLLDLGVSSSRIAVITNGVDLERFHPAPNQSASPPSPLAGEGRGGEAPTIIFVGRLIPNKGPDLLLEALLSLHAAGVTFRAAFLGDGPMRGELERRAAPLGQAVEFRGQVEDVATALRSADLFVRPSVTEGLPLAVLEAMATGICAVATDIAGNHDLIEDGKNGRLVGPRNAGALADAIRQLIQTPALRLRLAAAGRATAQRFAWDGSAEAMASVLTQAAAVHAQEAAA